MTNIRARIELEALDLTERLDITKMKPDRVPLLRTIKHQELRKALQKLCKSKEPKRRAAGVLLAAVIECKLVHFLLSRGVLNYLLKSDPNRRAHNRKEIDNSTFSEMKAELCKAGFIAIHANSTPFLAGVAAGSRNGAWCEIIHPQVLGAITSESEETVLLAKHASFKESYRQNPSDGSPTHTNIRNHTLTHHISSLTLPNKPPPSSTHVPLSDVTHMALDPASLVESTSRTSSHENDETSLWLDFFTVANHDLSGPLPRLARHRLDKGPIKGAATERWSLGTLRGLRKQLLSSHSTSCLFGRTIDNCKVCLSGYKCAPTDQPEEET